MKAISRRYAAWILMAFCSTPCGADSQLVWESGFENGFPGTEWLAFDNGSYSADGSVPPGRVSAWTIVYRQSGEPVFSGRYAYKGWLTGVSNDLHRAYPVIHSDFKTPLINTFMVYLDIDYSQMTSGDWIHLGTWGNHDSETRSGRWALNTLAVRERKLEFAHTAPFHGEYIGPKEKQDVPLRRWIRFTVYLHYRQYDGFVQVWQDGVPILRAEIPQLKQHPGDTLRTAHWGMYAPGSLNQGSQFNDDIRICLLRKPLENLVDEPNCPGTPVNPDAH